jgi:hypothetical protein
MESTLAFPSVSTAHEGTVETSVPAGPGLVELYGKVPLRLLLLFALYACPAVVVMRTALDSDIWWHLRTGQWIVEHAAVPLTDPFSSFGQDRPWLAYSWLFEVLIYGLYRGLGLAGIVLFRVVVVFLVAVAIHGFVAKRESRLLPAAGLVGLAFLALSELMNERPWLFTILFSVLTLDLVLDLRAGRSRRDLWLLPVLYAVWANLHIQFVYGLFLLALGCAAPWLDRLPWFTEPYGPAARAGSPAWRRLVAVTVACLLATLLTPYHIRLYGVVIEYATQTGMNDFIQEFLALPFRNPADWGVLVLALLATFALGRRRTFSSFELGLLIAAAYLCFHSRRDAWFMVLAALTILTRGEDGAICRLPVRFTMRPLDVLTVGVGVAALLVVLGWGCNVSNTGLKQSEAFDYPAKAADFIESKGYDGPLYNDFNWGGYLIWRLPRLPVSLDGRTNLHGEPRLYRSFWSWAGRPGWASDPELKAARLVIGPAHAPLMSLLRMDHRMELVYVDPLAMVYVARDAPAQAESLKQGRDIPPESSCSNATGVGQPPSIRTEVAAGGSEPLCGRSPSSSRAN